MGGHKDGSAAVLAEYSADGTVYKSFGQGGQSVYTFGHTDAVFNAAALQPDGKFVGGGLVPQGTGYLGILARFNVDGSPDPTFGAGGVILGTFGGTDDKVSCVAIQPDGKVLAGGYKYNGTHYVDALARFTSTGTPDTSFGTAGYVVGIFGGTGGAINSVVVQGDGKVLAGGVRYAPGTGILARFTSTGTLDTTWGTAGIQSGVFTGSDDTVYAVAIQGDGKVLAGGGRGDGTGNSFAALARSNANGTFDTTFGAAGHIANLWGGTFDSISSMALQTDGKAVVSGFTGSPVLITAAVGRLTSTGTPDTTFGTAGKMANLWGGVQDFANAVALQPDGRVVLGGSTSPDGTITRAALARLTSTGSPDTTFGTLA